MRIVKGIMHVASNSCRNGEKIERRLDLAEKVCYNVLEKLAQGDTICKKGFLQE